ncbi:GyrI-like domain-containing protein [Clostridium sp. 19966]|uniref:GyrI-like domain-containing protein n=1 Tax=Clostridium sp. 19966 TaxID=2768166 RepID=UPI0028DFD22B|nr:GyrI-like domain-containing protein [Clostridium sp. 19966]MDT8716809.1 GyrI-like domain-containing protein [Clostridium sp. 19966]
MGEKFDYKKEFKDLYLPKVRPSLVNVPSMNFIMLDGKGDPNGEEYQAAIPALYSVAFTIKMSRNPFIRKEDYFDYVVPPLEGLWWIEGKEFSFDKRENWLWTSMIRQPEFVTEEIFKAALEECKNKKPEIDLSGVRFEAFNEGDCVQMLHVGPYSAEPASLGTMRKYMEENNLKDATGKIRKHHEIYLSDPRRTASDSLKTVLRHPVEKID